jgi:hypothetical protein
VFGRAGETRRGDPVDGAVQQPSKCHRPARVSMIVRAVIVRGLLISA